MIFTELSQKHSKINWNSGVVWSKKKSNKKLKFNTTSDQKSEKFCISLWFVLSIKDKTTQPTKGDINNGNNIK